MALVSVYVETTRLARDLCDANAFRIGVALLLGLPFAGLAVMGAVVGGASLLATVAGLASGDFKAEELGFMLTMIAVFGGIAMAFCGIVARLVWSSAALAARPGLSRAILVLLTPPLLGLVLMAVTVPTLFTLTGLALVAVIWLGTWRPPPLST